MNKFLKICFVMLAWESMGNSNIWNSAGISKWLIVEGNGWKYGQASQALLTNEPAWCQSVHLYKNRPLTQNELFLEQNGWKFRFHLMWSSDEREYQDRGPLLKLEKIFGRITDSLCHSLQERIMTIVHVSFIQYYFYILWRNASPIKIVSCWACID